jgi:uncharacterized protein YqeY
MPTRAELENALKDALRSGNEQRKNTIRMVLSAAKLAEVEKGASKLDESGLAAIIQKEIKSRREAISDAQKANRQDLIEAAQAEIAILEGFLPKSFSSEELEDLARQVVTEIGATSIREMGQVMKVLMPRLQGRATGDQASQVVRKLLQ